jgi:hypothetical protein
VTEGHAVVWIGRRGKHLLIDMGVATYVIHLMQGGRLRVDEKQAAKPRGGQARWSFADGRALLLTEPGTERKAGVWLVTGDPEEQEPLAGLGPDADLLDDAALAQLLAARSQRLHGFLRDQRVRRRRRPPPGQRDLPPGEAVPVRHHLALTPTRWPGWGRRSAPPSPRAWPTSGASPR